MTHQPEPAPEIVRVCDGLDEFIQRFAPVLEQTRHVEPILEEARLKLIYILSHTTSAVFLAKSNLEAFASAMIIGRSVFEIGTRLYWILSPDNPDERNLRRLRHLKSFSEYYRKMGNDIGANDVSLADEYTRTSESISAYIDDHAQGTKITEPDFKSIVNDIGTGKLYIPYRKSSQYIHGSYIFLLNERVGATLQEPTITSDELSAWWEALNLCWMGIILSLNAYGKLAGIDFHDLADLDHNIPQDLEKLRGDT